MTVRPRLPADIAACVAVLEAVRAADGYPVRWPDDPTAWISPARSRAYVADVDGAVVGHACVVHGAADVAAVAAADVPADQVATLSRLFVTPTARGRGLGEALITAATLATSAAGQRLSLDVVDDDRAAVALYERLGWLLVDRRPADWLTPAGERWTVRVYLAPEQPPATS